MKLKVATNQVKPLKTITVLDLRRNIPNRLISLQHRKMLILFSKDLRLEVRTGKLIPSHNRIVTTAIQSHQAITLIVKRATSLQGLRIIHIHNLHGQVLTHNHNRLIHQRVIRNLQSQAAAIHLLHGRAAVDPILHLRVRVVVQVLRLPVQAVAQVPEVEAEAEESSKSNKLNLVNY